MTASTYASCYHFAMNDNPLAPNVQHRTIQPALFMNCRNDRAEIGFAKMFLEAEPYQWARPTENKYLGEFKIKLGCMHICEQSGLKFI